MHSRWKTMPLNSESCWSLYKEMVSGSQDKALEIFVTKKVDSPVHFDLNQCASHEVQDTTSSPPRMTQHEMSQPTITQQEASQPPSPIQNDHFEDRKSVV